MKKNKLISIVIPSYNEEKNIAKVIKACQKLKKLFPIEIIVVDGGSQDKTVEIAKKCRVDKLIAFPYKRGKGTDFWAGAVSAKGNFIIQIDADFQFQPEEIPLFVKNLKEGADIVIGSRFSGGKIQKGSLTTKNLLGNKILSLFTTIATGKKITDVMAGFKGFRKEALLALDLRERHFEYEAETVVKAIKMGMRLVEIPITYKKRLTGESGIRALRDGLNVAKAIAKAKFSKAPSYKNK